VRGKGCDGFYDADLVVKSKVCCKGAAEDELV